MLVSVQNSPRYFPERIRGIRSTAADDETSGRIYRLSIIGLTEDRRYNHNFFIVGAANSGTTSLYSSGSMRRVSAGSQRAALLAQIKPWHEQRHLRSLIGDQQEYLKLFRKAKGYKAIGEASPSYLWEAKAPYRIHRVVPHAKIIIVLRDPVERAYSHYLMDVREGLQDLSFHDALKQDWSRREKGWSESRVYIELGLYAERVRRLLKSWRERVLILSLEELIASALNGKSVVADVLRFLELDTASLFLQD